VNRLCRVICICLISSALSPVASLAGDSQGKRPRKAKAQGTAPQVVLPDSWGGAAAGVPALGVTSRAAELKQWWKNLGDPQLDGLIEAALNNNIDMRIAERRVRQARAVRGVANSARYPEITQNDLVARRRSVIQTPGGLAAVEGTAFQIGFDANWELDFFGGVRNSVRAATADVLAAEESQRDVMVTVIAEVARNYVALRGYQRQLAVTRANIETQRDTRDLTAVRARAGLATDLDVSRVEAQLARTESAVPALEAAADDSIHRLGVLLGTAPGASERIAQATPTGNQPGAVPGSAMKTAKAALPGNLLGTAPAVSQNTARAAVTATLLARLRAPEPIPAVPSEIPIGLPPELLRRRPDIRRAEAEILAEAARLGVARSELYPKLVLSGAFGRFADGAGGLTLGIGNFFALGPSVRIPIFNAGRIRSNIRAQDERVNEALLVYENTVNTAVQEVENSLADYEGQREQQAHLKQAVSSSRRAVDLSLELYTAGLADFLSVLEAQNTLYANEDELAQSEAAVVLNLVALYKALGGGW